MLDHALDQARTHRIGLALAIAGLLLLLPLWVAPVPPMTDYPNHLARLWLLAGGVSAPELRGIYAIRWDTVTNVAIDLIGATLGRVTSYDVAGRVSVALAILLPPLGGALLWRAVHGRWHWWVAAFPLLVWGQALLNGFLNFVIGLGVALLAAAAEDAVARRRVLAQLVLRALFAALLLLCHPFALLFYLVLVAALAWGPSLRPRWGAILRRGAAAAVSVAVAGAVFFALTSSLPGTQEHAGLGTVLQAFRTGVWEVERDPWGKAAFTFLAFRAYGGMSDAACGVALLLPLALAAVAGRLRVHVGLLLAGALLVLCYAVFPRALLGAFWVDTRFAIMAPFALVAALAPDLPGTIRAACAALVIATGLGRTAAIAWVWHASQADIAAVARAYDAIPPGAKVLPVEHRPYDVFDAPPGRYSDVGAVMFRHLPALGVPWRQVFVPTIFSARGKQPLEILPPWDAISEPNGGQIADVHVLDDPAVVKGLELAAYARDWRRFDYVLVLNADLPDDDGPLDPVPDLTLIRDEGFARVYRIDHHPAPDSRPRDLEGG